MNVPDFFMSVRWQMAADGNESDINGGIIFPAGIARPTLERRKLDKKYGHLKRRLFDPQLYLSSLDPAKAAKACAKLASYEWFDGTTAVYDSGKQKQGEWLEAAKLEVGTTWSGKLPTDRATMEDRVRLCVQFQAQLGCEAAVSGILCTAKGGRHERNRPCREN